VIGDMSNTREVLAYHKRWGKERATATILELVKTDFATDEELCA
jgi:hypothetical protein